MMQDYSNARVEYNAMNEDVLKQVAGIQKEIETVLNAIEQGREEIRYQAEQLGSLKTSRSDQKRELEKLGKSIVELSA